MLISTSYALWTVNIEKNNNLNIVAGVLNYELTSPELNGNKQVVVPANSEKRINITMKSLNAIDSDYSVYYQGPLPSGVTIMYDGTNSKPSDNISITGTTKSMTIIIRNNSGSNYTATLGVKGGLTNKGLALDSNTYQITNPYSFSKDYAYIGNYQTFTAPIEGYYNIETWGAAGGGTLASKGGYSGGVILLNRGESLYLYIGEYVGNDVNKSPYNGGGVANSDGRYKSGGGATDVRLVAGAWDNIASLRSRIMVAGGAGGSFEEGALYLPGGYGGNLFGGNGTKEMDKPSSGSLRISFGGTPISGGIGGVGLANVGIDGTFGIGANGKTFQAAGGGGYYGGGSSGINEDCAATGAGGSSFISGYAGVNAINEAGTHTNNTLHFSGKYFINGKMQAGSNMGDGKAKITFISSNKPINTNSKVNNVRYIRDCLSGSNINTDSHWTEFQAIRDGVNLAKGKVVPGVINSSFITDGNISGEYDYSYNWGSSCVTLDLGSINDLDEVAVWHYFIDSRAYYNHTLSVSSNNNNWVDLIYNQSGVVETSDGKRFSAWN